MLCEHDITRIHDASMQLLNKVGVLFPHPAALAVFEEHNIRTDGNRVFFSERQLMDAIGRAPRQFTLHARNPARDVVIGGGKPVFAPGYGSPFLVDIESGCRPGTLADYADLVKLAQMLPHQDLSGHLMVEPSDVPPDSAHLHMLYANMLHSDKPFIGSSAGERGASHTMEMAALLFQGPVGERPVTMAVLNSLSPLGYSSETLAALLVYARHRQPILLSACSMAGSTGPITLAGVLVHQNAELLAGIALAQLVSPGTPVVYGSTSTNLDLRRGVLALGSPELSRLITAHAALCRTYGLPSRSGGALTDACYPSAQAGYESMLSLSTTINCGIDFILHAGGILNSFLAFSAEKLVIDDELCGLLQHYHRPLVVDDETLALDSIARVGPGGNFLMEPETLERCRTAFWQPAVSDRAGLDAWMGAGRPEFPQQVRRRVERLLAEHVSPPLEAGVVQRLRAFVADHETR